MEEIKELSVIDAPYGKQITIKNVSYDNGFNMMRIRIKEGKRFTDMDLDANTVKAWHAQMTEWLAQQPD